jgi:hypothetical protein
MQKPTRAQRVCLDCGAAVQFEIPDGARYRDYLGAAMAKHRSRVWGNCPGSPWAERGEAPRLPSVAPAGRRLRLLLAPWRPRVRVISRLEAQRGSERAPGLVARTPFLASERHAGGLGGPSKGDGTP